MKYSLPASLLVHILIGASGMFAWSVAPRESFQEIIDIRLEGIELGEFTDISEIQKPDTQPTEDDIDDIENDPTDEDLPPPDDPETENSSKDPDEGDALPDFKDEELPKPVPTPTPTPTPTKTPTPTPTPTKTQIVEDRSKTKTDKPSIDDLLSDTEDLLKDLQNDPKKTKTQTPGRKELTDQSDVNDRKSAGKKEGNEASVIDVIRAQIKQRECWRSVKDLPDWEKLDVTIRFQLDSKGRISKPPERIEPRSIDSHGKLILVASERAIRAIQLCAPFNLPEEEYELWRNEDIILTFDEAF